MGVIGDRPRFPLTESAITTLLSANSGNLTLKAGNASSHDALIYSEGADLLAGQTITLEADRIDLAAAANTTASRSHTESKSFTIGAKPSGFIGSALNQAIEGAMAAHEGTGNKRLDNAYALKSGYDAFKGVSDLAGGGAVDKPGAKAQGDGSAFGISINVGSSKSSSNNESASSQALGTNMQAKDIALTARETDIRLEGAKLQAENISLDAARDLLLLAAANTSSLHSDNKSSSVSVGVTVGFGQQNGISFQIGAQLAKGRAEGDETLYDNTLITATDHLKVKSGQDTTLAGAQLAGKQVTMDVGRNLNIETLQDSSYYDSVQKSGGFGISLCIPPICAGTSSVSVNAASQKIKHSYLSAVGQSGIAAGDGGFDIAVGKNTDLVGAAITSTADASKNHLSTASLTSRDLTNAQNTESKSMSIALSGSYGSGAGSAVSQVGNNVTSNVMGNQALKQGMPKSGSEQSQTLSVISPAQISITGTGNTALDAQSQTTADLLTTRDPKTANQSLKNTLTLQQASQVEEQLKQAKQSADAAQMLVTLGQRMSKDLGTYAANKVNAIDKDIKAAQDDKNQAKVDELNAEKAKWVEGGDYRVALHALIGGVTGGVQGALGAGAAAAAAPTINELTKDLPESVKGVAGALIAGGIGAIAGGKQGAVTALNEDLNNRQLHPGEQETAKRLYKLAKEKGLSYTLADIMDAMRVANYKGEAINTNSIFNPKAPAGTNNASSTDAYTDKLFDQMVPGVTTNASQGWVQNTDGSGSLAQNLSSGQIKSPTADLAGFIKSNTTDYSWDAGSIARPPSDPHAGMSWTSNGYVPILKGTGSTYRYETFSADGKTFALPIVSCPAASCTSDSAIAWFTDNLKDQATLAAYKAALSMDVTKGVIAIPLVVGTAMFAPPTLATITVGRVLTGSGLGGAFDAAGQTYKIQTGGQSEYKYMQTLIAATTGGLAAPYASSSVFTNALVGGTTSVGNTGLGNLWYGEKQSVVDSFLIGYGASGLGTQAGGYAHGLLASKMPAYIGGGPINPTVPALLQNIGHPNLWPHYVGVGVEQSTTTAIQTLLTPDEPKK